MDSTIFTEAEHKSLKDRFKGIPLSEFEEVS
jgi:hypothetical protein